MNLPAFEITDPLPMDLRPGLYELRSSLADDVVAARFSEAGWAVAVVNLGDMTDKPGIMEAFAQTLAFPGWVGRNWDALDDALGDLSWWPAGPRGRLLLVRGRAEPGSPSGHHHQLTLRDVLETAVISWTRTDSPLLVLVRS